MSDPPTGSGLPSASAEERALQMQLQMLLQTALQMLLQTLLRMQA
ncbi:hypothetical protein GCM10009608_21360 [Pseudonocardia alaniniphila]